MAKKSKKNNDNKLYYKISIPIAIIIVVAVGIFLVANSGSGGSEIYDADSDVADDVAWKESALSGKAAASSRENGGIRGDTCESADECQLGLTCRKRVPNRYRNGGTIPGLDRNFAYREDSKCANKMWDNYPCAYHTQCKSGFCSEDGRCQDMITESLTRHVSTRRGNSQSCDDMCESQDKKCLFAFQGDSGSEGGEYNYDQARMFGPMECNREPIREDGIIWCQCI